jgi:hypothetical protein
MKIKKQSESTIKVKKLLRLEKSSPVLIDEGQLAERIEWQLPDGTIHRQYGPAIIYKNGSTHWIFNGLKHRSDGPASEWSDGAKQWWVKNELHRIDGPAMIDSNGSKKWYNKGIRHRDDGPAIEWVDKTLEYWIKGRPISEEDFLQLQYK